MVYLPIQHQNIDLNLLSCRAVVSIPTYIGLLFKKSLSCYFSTLFSLVLTYQFVTVGGFVFLTLKVLTCLSWQYWYRTQYHFTKPNHMAGITWFYNIKWSSKIEFSMQPRLAVVAHMYYLRRRNLFNHVNHTTVVCTFLCIRMYQNQ